MKESLAALLLKLMNRLCKIISEGDFCCCGFVECQVQHVICHWKTSLRSRLYVKPVVPKTTCDSIALLFGQGNSLCIAAFRAINTDNTDLLLTTEKRMVTEISRRITKNCLAETDSAETG